MWGTTLRGGRRRRSCATRVAEARELRGADARCVEATLLADLPAATAGRPCARSRRRRCRRQRRRRQLMDALPPLARVVRYGNVRDTDAAAVAGVVDGPRRAHRDRARRRAVSSLDDEAAADMARRIGAVHGALGLLERERADARSGTARSRARSSATTCTDS